jgi:tetratricopeptide (TPR) repeat protein
MANRRVRRLADEGRLDEAVAVAARYVRLRPSDIHAWVDLGDCLLHTDVDAACEAMERALLLHPHEPHLTYLLVTGRLKQGRLDEAEALLTHQWEESPESFFPMIGRVKVAKARGDWNQAVELGQAAAEHIPPRWPWGKNALAVELMPLPAGRALAERLLSEAVRALPPGRARGLGHLYLGALIESARPQEADEHFAEARSLLKGRVDVDEMLVLTRRMLLREDPLSSSSE